MQRRHYFVLTSGLLVVLTSIVFAIAVRVHSANKQHGPSTPSMRAQQLESPKPALNIKKLVPHGHIVEIIGETEPNTTVMVNGEKAALVFDGGSSFRHFVGPLPDGVTNISVTVQSDDGRVNTKQLAVVLP